MAFFTWTRWFRSLARPQVKPIRSTRTRRWTPRLEALEDRLAPAALTWNGQGGSPNWSVGANWVGGVAPTGNGTEDLVFPASAAQFNTLNNLPTSPVPTFNSITISGDNYTVGGNPLTLGALAAFPTG